MSPTTHSFNHSRSLTSSGSDENIPLNISTAPADLYRVSAFNSAVPNDVVLMSCDRVLEIARQYEADKNAAASEVKRLSRKLADITDNNFESSRSGDRLKRRRTYGDSEPQPPNSDEEDVDTISNDHVPAHTVSADDNFVYQAGHKFVLVHAPWVYSGDEVFDIKVDEHYNPAERFENDKNKLQGERKVIQDLLQVRISPQALHQRWLRRQVSFIYILQLPTTHMLLVHERGQYPTI